MFYFSFLIAESSFSVHWLADQQFPLMMKQSLLWDGPLSEKGRATKPGNSRYGKNCMEVLKADTPYKAGPISSLAQR